MCNRQINFASRLAIDFFLWFGSAAVFLYLYVGRFNGPTTAILPHLRVVAFIALMVASCRYCLHRWGNARWATCLGAICAATVFLALLIYYSAILAGLDGWGRVISWSLITTYSAQAHDLLNAIEISPITIIIGVGIIYIAVVVSINRIHKKWDWVPMVARLGTPRFSATIFSLLLGSLLLSAWRFNDWPPTETGEPIALTLAPVNLDQSDKTTNREIADYLDLLERLARTGYEPVKPPTRPNVILIVVDALRADHLSINGYQRATTPYLEELLRTGKPSRIGRMYSACSESVCGLKALGNSRNFHDFPNHPFSLREVLRLHGYSAHMVMSGDHTNFYGLRNAYGAVDTYYDGSMASGYYMNDDQLVVDHLAGFPDFSGKPAFFQFHLMSAHPLGKRQPKNIVYQPSTSYATNRIHSTNDPNGEHQSYINFYDNGVIQADQTIHRLMETLRKKNYLKQALVVITADHGELLGEHGIYAHAKTVSEPVLNIPFILLHYGFDPVGTIPAKGIGSQIDIAPTILTELRIPVPRIWAGSPLQSSTPKKSSRYIFFQQDQEFGLIETNNETSRWKYWTDTKSGSEFAYELLADPGEHFNRAAELPQAVKARWRQDLFNALPKTKMEISRSQANWTFERNRPETQK